MVRAHASDSGTRTLGGAAWNVNCGTHVAAFEAGAWGDQAVVRVGEVGVLRVSVQPCSAWRTLPPAWKTRPLPPPPTLGAGEELLGVARGFIM